MHMFIYIYICIYIHLYVYKSSRLFSPVITSTKKEIISRGKLLLSHRLHLYSHKE